LRPLINLLPNARMYCFRAHVHGKISLAQAGAGGFAAMRQ
jgi:hypothetical protein